MKHFFLRLLRSSKYLFFASLILHVGAILLIGHYRHPELWENGSIAHNLFDGKGFTMDFSIPGESTSWQSPGYPYLLDASWKIFGQTSTAYLVISLLQAVAVSSMLFPVGWLTRRWCGDDAAAFSRVLTILMPLYLWYGTRIHQTAFVMSAHPWLLWGWLRVVDIASRRQAILTGLGTGIAGLFQPLILIIFGFFSGLQFSGAILKRQFSTAFLIVIAGLLTLLVITPWTLRNYQVHHRLLLIKDSFGKEFWMGNNPHSTGTAYIEGGMIEVTSAYPPHIFEKRGQLPEIEIMEGMQREAWEYIKEKPSAFLKRTIKKLIWFWTLAPSDLVRHTGAGEALTFRWVHAAYWFSFMGLTLAAGWHGKFPLEYRNTLLLYVLLYSTVYSLIHVGLARYRGEIEFIFLPAVAAGLHALWIGFSPWEHDRKSAMSCKSDRI